MTRSFKARHLCAVAGFAVVGFAQYTHATNLLVNPGFESPADTSMQTDNTASGWSFGLHNVLRSPFHVTEQPTSGNWDIWLQTFNPSSGNGVAQIFSSGFTVGATYTLTADTYFEQNFPSSAAIEVMKLNWEDSSGNPVGTAAVLNIDPTDPNLTPPVQTGVWSPYSVSGVAPAGATQVQVFLGYNGGTPGIQQESAFFDNADLEGPGNPPNTAVWLIDGSADWNILSNWATGTVPNGVGIEADLTGAIQSNHTIFTDTAITLGTLLFNNSHTYVVTGAGSLTLQAAGSNSAEVVVQAGTQKLDLPTTIASNTILNVSSGANLIIANPLTINSGKTLTQMGAGSVTYQSIISVASGAGIAFGNATHAHELDVAATGTAAIGGSGSTVTVDVLNNGGKIDVKNNTLAVSYGTGTDPASTIQNQLTTGYAGGAWTGPGINSSAATSKIGVGWKDDTSGKTVTVKSTYYGDTNLDGVVNTSDFTNLSQHFGAATASAIWANGDFNYDGKVNALDFNALATNFGATPLSGVALGTLVPEPISAMLLIPIGALLAGRRRRNRA
jgi:hypothetical protein